MAEKGPKNKVIKLFTQKSNRRFPRVRHHGHGGSQVEKGRKNDDFGARAVSIIPLLLTKLQQRTRWFP